MSHLSLVVLCPENLRGVSGDHGQGRVSVRGACSGSMAYVMGEQLACELRQQCVVADVTFPSERPWQEEIKALGPLSQPEKINKEPSAPKGG